VQPVIVVVPKMTIPEFLQTPFSPQVDLYDMCNQLLGPTWFTGSIHQLGFLHLEQHVNTSGNEQCIQKMAQKRKDILTRLYVVVDPITLIIPLLVDPLNSQARLIAATEDIKKMACLFNEICVEMHIQDHMQLPLQCNMNEFSGITITHRLQKEQRALAAFEDSQWVQKYLELQKKYVELMKSDTAELQQTLILPPTPAMPQAAWSPL
jgi:hypothetical protein